MYASSTAPAGWLLADGTEYTTSTYPRLWTIVGYLYGGSTSTFRVLNIGGRTVVAPSSTSPFSTTIGATGGATSTNISVRHQANLNGTGGGGSGAALTIGASGDFITSTGFNAVIDPFIILNYIIKY